MPKVSRKAQKMVDYLEEMIAAGRFPEGGRIPPLRELETQFQLSYGTVNNGIASLCARGLLEKRARSGIFVARQSPAARSVSGKHLISVFNIRRGSLGLYETVLCGLREAAPELGVELQLCQIPGGCVDRDIFARLSAESAGVILLGEFDRCVGALPLGKPCVGVIMHDSAGGRMSIVDIDPFAAAELAADFLAKKNVAAVRAVTVPIDAYRNRAEIFISSWRRRGGVGEVEECAYHFDRDGFADPGVVAHLRPEFGYYFASDNLLYNYFLTYRQVAGRRLTDDFTVISVDGKRLLHPDFPVFPTIAGDWRRIGRRALEECCERIRHPGRLPGRLYLPGQLVTT